MKKTNKRIVFTGILSLFLISLMGCSSTPVSYEKKSYEVSAAEVETVTIDVKDRKIEILQSDDTNIHISYFASEKEFYTIDLLDNKELSMVNGKNKDWKDYIGGKAAEQNREIKIWIPNKSLKNLNLKTSNEDITLPSLAFSGAVNIKINNGNVQLDLLNVGTAATLETKNGNISGSILGSYDEFVILSKVKKGENNLPENKKTGLKKLSAFTNNGDIALEFVDTSDIK